MQTTVLDHTQNKVGTTDTETMVLLPLETCRHLQWPLQWVTY
jgi:hypothetical protein